MSDIIDLLFHADTHEVEEAKDKLKELGEATESVGDMLEGLAKAFMSIPGPVGLAVVAFGIFAAGVKEMVESTLESEVQLLEFSEAIGVPIEKLQPFAEAMALAGVSSDKLQSSLGKLAQQVGNAIAEPTGKAADAFKKLGVSQKELQDGDIEQILKDTVAGLDKYADSATKVAVERELLGKQGPAIVAAMQQEAEFEAMAADAQRQYGTAITEADAKSAKYFGETLKLGMSMFEGVSVSVTRSLLPGLQELVNQFAASGKEGGFLRAVLDGLSATIIVVAKVIISGLYEPIHAVITVFKEMGTTIGATFAAVNAAVHGNLSEAKSIITDLGKTLHDISQQSADDANRFEAALWKGASAVEEEGKAAEDTRPKLEAFNAAGQRITNMLNDLRASLAAQLSVQAAAARGLQEYKDAQDEVALSALKMKLQQEGATAAQVELALSMKRQEDASKQATTSQVSGWEQLKSLTEQYNALLSKNTELEKVRSQLSANPGITKALQEQLVAEAKLVDEKKQQLEVDKDVQNMNQQVVKTIDGEKQALTLSASALKLYTEELKLTQQFEKDAFGKTPEQVRQLTTALQQAKTQLEQNNQQLQQWTQSWAGFAAGSQQAMANLYQSATNLNTLGKEMTTNFVNGLTTAFVNMQSQGANAFKTLANSLVQFIETAIIKFALLKAMIATMEAMGVSPANINLMLGAGTIKANAAGNAFSAGSIIPFAQGGVLSGPTLAPMALMGEAGPEAVMPLQRTASGKLGVAVTGDSSAGGGSVNHYYGGYVIVNTPHDPAEVGKQIKKQMNNMKMISRGEVAQALRPGGILNRPQGMFAR